MVELGNLRVCAPNCWHQVHEANLPRPKFPARSFRRRLQMCLSPDRASLNWTPGKQLHLTLAVKCARFSDGKKKNSYRFAVISIARVVRSMRSVTKSMNGGRVVVHLPNGRWWRKWLAARERLQAQHTGILISLPHRRLRLRERLRSGSTRLHAWFSFFGCPVLSLESLEESPSRLSPFPSFT